MSEQAAYITCESLVKIFQVANIEVFALQGLDLEVQQGELISVVGASGSGKTTLMNVLGGLIRPSAGKALVDGQNLLKMSQRELDEYRQVHVGFVWQQGSRNLVPYLSALENVKLPLTMSGKVGKKVTDRAAELLGLVGMADRRHHKLAQLSGGEQQRVAIAVSLANQPKILLADEPTGDLDLANSDMVYETFRNLNRELRLTTIIVSHDPAIAQHVGRVIAIRDGKTATETVRRRQNHDEETHDPEEFEELTVLDSAGRLQIPKEYREMLEIRSRVTVELTAEGVLIRPAEDVGASVSSEARPVESKAERQSVLFGRFGQRSESMSAANAVLARQVARVYETQSDTVYALRDINLTINPGQLVALKGRSGSGKTTLLNCIGGLDKPTQGQIHIYGQDLSAMSDAQRTAWRRHQMGFVFQSMGLLPMFSAYENLDMALRLAGIPRRERRDRILFHLEQVGLFQWADHRPFELSGGQQQRVAVARALVAGPRLILADEPTSELDSETTLDIMALLRRVVDEQGTTILLTSHDPLVDEYVDDILYLEDGRILRNDTLPMLERPG
jgi:peptide/nickel transport system ATP-binding protein